MLNIYRNVWKTWYDLCTAKCLYSYYLQYCVACQQYTLCSISFLDEACVTYFRQANGGNSMRHTVPNNTFGNSSSPNIKYILHLIPLNIIFCLLPGGHIGLVHTTVCCNLIIQFLLNYCLSYGQCLCKMVGCCAKRTLEEWKLT
jgi:hypothetical protein